MKTLHPSGSPAESAANRASPLYSACRCAPNSSACAHFGREKLANPLSSVMTNPSASCKSATRIGWGPGPPVCSSDGTCVDRYFGWIAATSPQGLSSSKYRYGVSGWSHFIVPNMMPRSASCAWMPASSQLTLMVCCASSSGVGCSTSGAALLDATATLVLASLPKQHAPRIPTAFTHGWYLSKRAVPSPPAASRRVSTPPG
mmetsp:Transcript_57744/g.128846  ORF Transcript_57744/g.128846 Transcript_57744/m.128846 type:complete len:202 (+) Transcript_57744:211-816(+)